MTPCRDTNASLHGEKELPEKRLLPSGKSFCHVGLMLGNGLGRCDCPGGYSSNASVDLFKSKPVKAGDFARLLSERGGGRAFLGGAKKSLNPRIFKIDINKKFDILKRLHFRRECRKKKLTK